jgi:hypothetical protein
MDNFLMYLLKVSVGTMVLYLCFILFFSRDTFYRRNRIFLIIIMVLPFIIPFLRLFSFSYYYTTVTEPVIVMKDIILTGAMVGTAVTEKVNSFSFTNLAIWIYFIVTGLFLLRGVISVAKTFEIIRKGRVIDTTFPKVILSDHDHPPFSFFPYVVVSAKTIESDCYRDILEHEFTHIRQGHTFDMLLSELLIAILWFNPFIWLIKRVMVLNHEFLADSKTLKRSLRKKEYQFQLLSLPEDFLNVTFAHNFSGFIKNRIIMINKNPTRKFAALKGFIIIPAAAMLFALYSFKTESYTLTNGLRSQILNRYPESGVVKFVIGEITDLQESTEIQAMIAGYKSGDTLKIADLLKTTELSLSSKEYTIVSFNMLFSDGVSDYEERSISNKLTKGMKNLLSKISNQDATYRYLVFRDIVIQKPEEKKI